ncbi:MAG TPA: outer membrane beta-barrel protein [Hyphomicrobium sp.]|jgi:opacity protein-like surface antigen
MNSNRSSYLLGAALGTAFVLGLGGNAMAGEDIYGGGYGGGLKGGYDVPPPPPSDRGLYFRAYVGQANTDVGSIWTPGYENNTVTVFNHDMKSSPLYGIGIGYKRNRWLRFDLTGEYRGDAAFFAMDRLPNTALPTGLQTNEYTADVKSWLGLANAYWDIATWCGFTPYVGAGIGFATLTVDGLKDVNVPANSVFFGASNTTTNFAWAIHAGVAYDVSPQFAIDLSYRYADLGNASSGVVTAYDGSSSYSEVAIRDITSNDLLLGVRYKLHREQPVMYAVK